MEGRWGRVEESQSKDKRAETLDVQHKGSMDRTKSIATQIRSEGEASRELEGTEAGGLRMGFDGEWTPSANEMTQNCEGKPSCEIKGTKGQFERGEQSRTNAKEGRRTRAIR